MSDLIDRLSAEFPREAVSWRAQSMAKDGDKALALCYIDARDVMDRLDEVVGAENWSDSYDVHPNVTICTIAIKTESGWVSKSDGAGDTDVEAEKGRISDALKRAAVHWGVGRYLYAIPSPWVPCDSWKDSNSKLHWKKWTADPWDYVKVAAKPPKSPAGGQAMELAVSAAKPHWVVIRDALDACTTLVQLNGEWTRHSAVSSLFPENFQAELKDHFFACRDSIKAKGGGEAKASLDAQFGEQK